VNYPMTGTFFQGALMAEPGSGKIPVRESVVAAWRFLFAHWTMFLPACLMVGLASVVAVYLLGGGGTTAEGEPVMNGPAMLLGALIDLVIGSMFAAAVLRKAVRNEFTGAAGLTFGPDEIRLIGVQVSLFLLIAPIVLLVFLAVFFIAVGRLSASSEDLSRLLSNPESLGDALSSALGPGGSLLFFLFMMLCFWVVLLVSVRLSLISAATIGERRAVVFQTWAWSQGNVFRLFAAIVLTVLPAALVSSLIEAVIGGLLGGENAAPPPLIQRAVIAGVAGTLSAVLSIPSLALAAHLYLGLRPRDFQAK
jgi:hypothetical protein